MHRYEDIIDDHPREYWEALMLQWIFDEQARTILTRWLLDGIPYEAIAEELKISRSTVYNKVNIYLPKLFKHCD